MFKKLFVKLQEGKHFGQTSGNGTETFLFLYLLFLWFLLFIRHLIVIHCAPPLPRWPVIILHPTFLGNGWAPKFVQSIKLTAIVNRQGIVPRITYIVQVNLKCTFLNNYEYNKYLFTYRNWSHFLPSSSPPLFFWANIKVESSTYGGIWFTLWFYFSIIFALYLVTIHLIPWPNVLG